MGTVTAGMPVAGATSWLLSPLYSSLGRSIWAGGFVVSLRYQCVTLLGGICNLSAEIHQGGQIDALEESGTFRG